MTDDYYSVGSRENIVISNSSLSYINPLQGGSPQSFLNFLDNIQGEEKSYFRLGSLIHKWAEDKENFIMGEVDKPSDKLGLAADYALTILAIEDSEDNYDNVILTACRMIGWNPNYGDAAIIKNACPQIRPYIEDVIRVSNSNKIYVTKRERETIINCVAAIGNHPLANKLLFGNDTDFSDKKVWSELEIYWSKVFTGNINGVDYQEEVSFKAKLDKLVIDFENKEIIYIDPKTTSKNAYDFKKSFEEYHYYRQLPFYEWAIVQFCKQQNIDITGFSFKRYNVVIETTNLYQVVVTTPDARWLSKGREEYQELIKRIVYHIATNQWNYSKEEFENSLVLEIDYPE